MKKYISPALNFEKVLQKEKISLEVGIDDIYNSSSPNTDDYEYEE